MRTRTVKLAQFCTTLGDNPLVLEKFHFVGLHWKSDPGNELIIPNGHELIFRKKRHTVWVMRRKIAPRG